MYSQDGEEIQVEMDGEWKTATAPDWLTTLGVSTCVAVCVTDNHLKKGWLIHSQTFGHNSEKLKEMIAEATKARPSGVGLKVWAFGGIDIVDHEEAARARMAVQGVLRSLAPKAATTICWKQCEFFEVIFGQDGWDCNL